MPNAINWGAAANSRSTVLTSQLDGLTVATGYSAVGSEIDNSTNLDEYGALEINLASLNPTAGAYLSLFLVQCLGGTNYEDAPSSTNPGYHQCIAVVSVTTGSAPKRIMTPWLRLPPCKFKFVLKNVSGATLNASGNTVTLYTANDEVQ